MNDTDSQSGQPVACVFCGHSPPIEKLRDDYLAAARNLALSLIAQRFGILTGGGGGSGIMHEVTQTALAHGAEVYQVIPDFLMKREGVLDNANIRVVDSMDERKRIMFAASDVFILAFGAIGSLDEFFEIITAIQLNIIHRKKAPVIVFNHDKYWLHLQEMLNHMIETGFLPSQDQNLFRFTTTIEETVALAREIALRKTP